MAFLAIFINNPQGYAYAEYVDEDITDAAIAALHGMELGEKKLAVQRYKSGLAGEAIEDGIIPGTTVISVLVQANEQPSATEVLVIMNAVDSEALDHDQYYQGM